MEIINHSQHQRQIASVQQEEGRREGGMKLEVLRKCSSLGPVGDGCGDFVNLYLGPAREQPTHQHDINPSTLPPHIH